MSQPSLTPGVYNPTITTSGSGSPAQQALATQQANAARQNDANQMAHGGSRKKLRGGAIALAPLPNASPSAVALNAQVQNNGAQSAANNQYDCAASNSCAKTGGRRKRIRKSRKTRTNKRKTRTNKRTKRRITMGLRK